MFTKYTEIANQVGKIDPVNLPSTVAPHHAKGILNQLIFIKISFYRIKTEYFLLTGKFTIDVRSSLVIVIFSRAINSIARFAMQTNFLSKFTVLYVITKRHASERLRDHIFLP